MGSNQSPVVADDRQLTYPATRSALVLAEPGLRPHKSTSFGCQNVRMTNGPVPQAGTIRLGQWGLVLNEFGTSLMFLEQSVRAVCDEDLERRYAVFWPSLVLHLASQGYERLLKIALCLKHLESGGVLPNVARFGHDIQRVSANFTYMVEEDPDYRTSQVDKAIGFLRSKPATTLMQSCSDFAKQGRYFSLNWLTRRPRPFPKFHGPAPAIFEWDLAITHAENRSAVPWDDYSNFIRLSRTYLMQRVVQSIIQILLTGSYRPYLGPLGYQELAEVPDAELYHPIPLLR